MPPRPHSNRKHNKKSYHSSNKRDMAATADLLAPGSSASLNDPYSSSEDSTERTPDGKYDLSTSEGQDMARFLLVFEMNKGNVQGQLQDALDRGDIPKTMAAIDVWSVWTKNFPQHFPNNSGMVREDIRKARNAIREWAPNATDVATGVKQRGRMNDHITRLTRAIRDLWHMEL